MQTIIEFFSGLVLLIAGSEFLVRGAAPLKRRLGVPDFVIGLLLVGFATSLPEIFIAIGAAGINAQDLALGTLIGSNIANSLLILGVVALIHPLRVDRRALARDGYVMLAASLAVFGFGLYGWLGFAQGVALIVGLAAYLILVTMDEQRLAHMGGRLHTAKAALIPRRQMHPLLALAAILIGVAGLILGAGLIVEATAGYAIDAGVSAGLLGLSLVAISTSLPELITSLNAARRGHSSLALGNIIGSNIFNLLAGGGLVALWRPAAFPAELHGLDIAVLAGAAALLLLALVSEKKLSRVEGALLLSGYAAYILWRVFAF